MHGSSAPGSRGRVAWRPRALLTALAVLTTVWTSPAASQPSGEVQTAAIAPGAFRIAGEARLPTPLDVADVERYRRIFALQETARWADADRLIARLENSVLLGHVLFQRYMHPTGWRSSFEELSNWLADYADHPGAERVHALAERRRPNGAAAPRPAEGALIPPAADLSVAPAERILGTPAGLADLSDAQKRRAEAIQQEVRGLLRERQLSRAERLIAGDAARRLLSPGQIDALATEIAALHLFTGSPGRALALVEPAAARSGDQLPYSRWLAGISAWMEGRLAVARTNFEALAVSRAADGWTQAAAAFWAARVHLVDRRPEEVSRWLRSAAGHPRTFYGLLARRSLALNDDLFIWEIPGVGPGDLERLAATARGHRALALIQVGVPASAEQELAMLARDSGPEKQRAILSVAAQANMATLAMRLSGRVTNADGTPLDAALYPVPAWEPDDGFMVDPALLYALIRQESRFEVQARSPAGAQGLMQLMPATARAMALEHGADGMGQLDEPAWNVTLGQRYIRHLLEQPQIEGDLLLAMAAYNAGPGNLMRWLGNMQHGDDPLLFIETLPSMETRQFMERVLANFWMYRQQAGQPTPSLDALASGRWPTFDLLSTSGITAADGYAH